MKRIVCVLGSPRPAGNSSTLAAAVCSAARASGAELAIFALNDLAYRGCQGCLACKREESQGCVLKDDLTPVLAAAAACDVLILASPVYFGEVSSQLKGFVDRTFSFLVPGFGDMPKERRSRLAPGKTLVMLLTQGNPRERFRADIFRRYSAFLAWQGFTRGRLLSAEGCRPGREISAAARPELLEQAAALGRELAGEDAGALSGSGN